MKRRSFAAVAVLCACVLALASRAEAGFVVVRNAKNATAKLAKEAVKRVFSGRTKTWSNDDTIILVIGTEDSPAMQWVADQVFGVSAKTFLTKLKQDVFKGDVPHPLSANDDAATIKRVQSGAGAVGLISDGAVKSLPPEVVVIPME